MASNRPGFLFCSTSVSHHLLPSIYICLGLLSPSCLKAPNPRNACILRISDSLYGGSRYIKGIYIYTKKWRFKILVAKDFPISNLVLKSLPFCSFWQPTCIKLSKSIVLMSATPISNVAPARIDSWRQKTFWVLWFEHMPSFTHWKRPSLGIIPEFVLALERWQINIVKRSDVEK